MSFIVPDELGEGTRNCGTILRKCVVPCNLPKSLAGHNKALPSAKLQVWIVAERVNKAWSCLAYLRYLLRRPWLGVVRTLLALGFVVLAHCDYNHAMRLVSLMCGTARKPILSLPFAMLDAVGARAVTAKG